MIDGSALVFIFESAIRRGMHVVVMNGLASAVGRVMMIFIIITANAYHFA